MKHGTSYGKFLLPTPTPSPPIMHYLNKLIAGEPNSYLTNSDTFEAGFLANWSDPAAQQVAERQTNTLKQAGSASNYATEFRVIASELEWDNAALMAAFCQGLKPFVRSKLIEHSIARTITTVENLITTTFLIENTLFEARQETQGTSALSTQPAAKQ
ncbi:hypothetical protein FRC12_005584 [Ceratobasidium sp. 428]|nr:hypothetical protein FRC12_005584 [Ceratobasidium sp. 428]